MRYIFSTLAFAIVSISLLAQETIEGNIEDWNSGNAQILTGSTGPIEIGQIDKKGRLTITLSESFVSKTKEDIENANKEDNSWKTTIMNLNSMFFCDDSTVVITNGTEPIINLSNMGRYTIGDIKERKSYGSFIISNSKEFTDAYRAYGKFKAVKGYYLDWYYFENAGSVNGNCRIKSYTVSSTEYITESYYNLEFKSGWNIVSYEISEIIIDEDGKAYPSKIIWKTHNELPKDVKFIFYPR